MLFGISLVLVAPVTNLYTTAICRSLAEAPGCTSVQRQKDILQKTPPRPKRLYLEAAAESSSQAEAIRRCLAESSWLRQCPKSVRKLLPDRSDSKRHCRKLLPGKQLLPGGSDSEISLEFRWPWLRQCPRSVRSDLKISC